MDNIIDKNDTGQNNISQEPEWPAGLNNEGQPLPDPRLVEKLVEELKSQGKFDQIRNDCFAEVDTQPAYQNLRSRVTETVQRFLGRQRWNPNLNKNQLRNQLKQHIQQTPFMEDGVERIVEQVVNPKIMSVIQPEVESLICSWFDVERPEGSNKAENENGNSGEMSSSSIANHDFSREEIKEGSSKSTSKTLEERRRSGANMSEKLSTVSSEDIAMRSADSDDDLRGGKSKSNTFLDRPISDTSSPGPGLRGDISPLTPERDNKPGNIMRLKEDDISANVPTAFLPSAPIDLPERSTTPQLKVKHEVKHENVDKESSQKAKNYTVKDFLSGSAASPRPIAAKIKKSTEFEDLLKKSEMIGSAKKENDLAKKKKEKEKDIFRKNKEKEKELMRRKKEVDIIRRQKEIDSSSKGKDSHSKSNKEDLKKEKFKSKSESKKAGKESNVSSRHKEKIDHKVNILKKEDIIEEDDDSPQLLCVCRKEDDGSFMIGCDQCDEWYHPRCINLSMDRVKELEDVEWACPQCENKKGNVSPLTPPPQTVRPVSPRTPPLPPYFDKNEDLDKTAVPPSIPLPPPPGEEDVLLQEEIVSMSNISGQTFKGYTEMSTVSNTEKSTKIVYENTHLEKSKSSYHSTPPVPSNLPIDEPPLPPEMDTRAEHTPPPPPPDSSFSKPASPLTSPIGSSPDDMEEPIRETSGYSSHSVMASDLRTPRQMQSQYNRATISDPAVNYNQGETQSSVSASDISDTDLPEASGTMSEDIEHENAQISMKNHPDDDLEALEKAKADLQAQLAATTIDESNVPMEDSDGEVHTDDSSDYMKRFREIASGSKLQAKTDDDRNSNRGTVDQMKTHVESCMSPISSEGPTPEPPKEKLEETDVTDDHGSEKLKARRKDHSDDDDESKGRPSSFDNVSGNSQALSTKASACSESNDSKSNSSDKSTKSEGCKERHQSKSSRRDSHHSAKKDIEKNRKSHSASSQHSSTKEDSKSSRHKTSHDGDKSRHSHSNRHKHDKDREKRRSSSKTEYDEKDEGSKRSDKHQDRKLDKESKRGVEKKREQKLKTFEEKVNQTYKLKSDKYEAIDMFAPKQTKNTTFPSPKTSSTTGKSLSPVSTAMRSQSVPSSGSTIASEHQRTPSVFAFSSNTSKDKEFDTRKGEQETIDEPTFVANNEIANKYDRKKLDRIKEQIKRERELNIISASPKNFIKDDSDSNEKARKIFPELPVSKCDGDKIEQHKDDYVVTKRRLEEARERKIADAHRKKEIDNSRTTLTEERPFWMDLINSHVGPLDMEIKMMAERRRKEKKKENKDRKKRDKDKLDNRERVKESRNSDDESSEFAMTPTKKAGKRKFSSRDSDGSSSSDNEWKKCGLKGNISPITPPQLTVRCNTKMSPIRSPNSTVTEHVINLSSSKDIKYNFKNSQSSLEEAIRPLEQENKYCPENSSRSDSQLNKPFERSSKKSECGSITRERRKRKPTNKYNSSDYNTEDSWEENDAIETTIIENAEQAPKNLFDIKFESELGKEVEVIMSTDVATEPFNGFGDEEQEKEIKTMYEKHISDAENVVDFTSRDNECKINDSCIPENFYEQNDFLYISELNAKTGIPKEWRGANKVATLLRKKFGGNPTVVHPLPRWLSLKLDRWGLRRHEVNIVTAASKLKSNHVYKEDEIDNQYPANQNMQNRFKRLTLMSNHLTKNEKNYAQNMPVSANSAIIKRRRDTIEKNLDEMFSSDQENDSDSNRNERKKARIEIDESKGTDNLVPSSSIQEPFHGFQENETAVGPQFDEATTQNTEEKSASGRTVLSNLKTRLIQVDSNGNTFGMDSVLASPISDFNSDYDDDEFLHPSLIEEIDNKSTDERLPMSVEMNYPMVQYLRKALKNEKTAVQELNRLLGFPNSMSPGCDKSDNYLQVENSIDKFTELNLLVKQTKQNENDGISKHFLHSRDKDSSNPSVATIGIHVLPPSPISNSDSLSSNEESKILLD